MTWWSTSLNDPIDGVENGCGDNRKKCIYITRKPYPYIPCQNNKNRCRINSLYVENINKIIYLQ